MWVKKSPFRRVHAKQSETRNVLMYGKMCILTCSLPETSGLPLNGVLVTSFPFGSRPIFKGALLVSGRVYPPCNSIVIR